MTEITEDMIGCLCWFNNYREIVIGILREIQTSPNGEVCYLDDNGYFYPECHIVKPDEVKFCEIPNKKLTDKQRLDVLGLLYSARTDKLNKLMQKIHKLEEENKKLKERLANVSKTIDHIGDVNEKVDHISQEAKKV